MTIDSEYRRKHNEKPAKEGYEAAVARYRAVCASAAECVRQIDALPPGNDDRLLQLLSIQLTFQDASHDVWDTGPWLDEFDDLWQAYRDVHDAHVRYLHRQFRWQAEQVVTMFYIDAETGRIAWSRHYGQRKP